LQHGAVLCFGCGCGVWYYIVALRFLVYDAVLGFSVMWQFGAMVDAECADYIGHCMVVVYVDVWRKGGVPNTPFVEKTVSRNREMKMNNR
jgi:hypothetical protein